jgi:uncharacterized membrane protein YdcZ (DUF606 family)
MKTEDIWWLIVFASNPWIWVIAWYGWLGHDAEMQANEWEWVAGIVAVAIVILVVMLFYRLSS